MPDLQESIETHLVRGFAQLLDADGIGVWSTDVPLSAGDVAVVTGTMPSSPDWVILLGTYDVDATLHGDDVVGLQVRCRAPGARSNVDDLAGAIRTEYHGATGVVLDGVRALLIVRQSHASLGRDTVGRHETSSNYYVTVARPTEHTR